MKSKTIHTLLASAALAALIVAGCQKDDMKKVTVSTDKPSSGLLSFNISENGGWSSSATKSGDPTVKGSTYRSESLLMDCDNPDSPLGDVYIYMVEEDIPADNAQPEVATRADGGDGSQQATSGFEYGVFAYQGSYTPATETVPVVYNPAATGVAPFLEIQNLKISAEGAYDGAEIYAPGDGFWLQFISYAPYMTVSETDGPNPALYKGTNYPYIKYTATPELAKNTDILFGGRIQNGAYSPICGDLNTDADGVTPSIELSFSHILSKVCINSEALSGKITSIKITDISYSGVYNNANSREWTFDPKVQDYAYRSTDGNGVETTVEGYYLIPQNLSDNATIEIKVSVPTNEGSGSREYTLTKKLNAFIAEWQPNKQYTYTITTPHEVQITVHDEVTVEGNFPVKKKMTVKNTGLADAYVRVAIVGSWVLDAADGSQYVISDWKESDGTFVWSTGAKPVEGSTNSNFWRLGPDGYYYYMKTLVPGEETKPLFDSYTLTASSPTGGSYLELVILANGVFVTDVQHIFHSTIVSALQN